MIEENHEGENFFKSLENVDDIKAEDIEDFNALASIEQIRNHSDECSCAEATNTVDLQNLEEQLQNICSQDFFYR